MATTPDGGPAFPMLANGTYYEGLSIRDWFAGQAIAAVIDVYCAANGNGCAADHALRNVPALAYKYADAMLAAREK